MQQAPVIKTGAFVSYIKPIPGKTAKPYTSMASAAGNLKTAV